jgi:hypothetical protein
MGTSLFSNDLWFMEKHLDIEYQTYRLLAYLHHVKNDFTQIKIYPHLRDLIKHYEFIDNISNKMDEINKRLSNDLDDDITTYIYEITEITKAETRKIIDEGISLFNIVLGSMTYETVGIVPEYKDDGYIIVSYDSMDYVDILRFQVSRIVDHHRFYIINVESVERVSNVSCLLKAPELLKGYLLGRYSDMPNPIVLHVRVAYYVPLYETLIPIIKRVLPVWIQRT